MTDGEAGSKSKKPFHESNWFRGTVAVVGLVGALWAFVGLPTPSHVVREATAHQLPLRNVEIILDASSRMGEQFGKASKLEVAAEAVHQYVVNDENIGLSLRRAGGSCGAEAEQLVNFDDGQTEKIAAAAKEQKPGGRSNWASAVRGAINDFSGESFQRPGSDNEVVLFVGGGDQCGGLVGQEVRNELQNANLHAQFRIYALKVPKKELKGLTAFEHQLKGVAPVELHKASSVKQLYEAVQEENAGGGGGSSGGGEGGSGSEGGGQQEAGGQATESQVVPLPEGLPVEEPPEASEEEREQAEKKAEEEKEEKEKEEAETEAEEEEEEELELKPAVEAPDAVVEPDGEGGEVEGGLGESKPAPVPEPAVVGKRAPRLSRISTPRSMTPSWTSRPNGLSCRGNSPLRCRGSSPGSWLFTR
jgi:hypothetical protein